MMRLATALGLICLSLLAFGLYQGAILTRQNEEALRNLDKQIASESEATRILKAEWSFLNQPERLQALAKKHLHLAPVAAVQFTQLARLPLRGETAHSPIVTIEDLPKRKIGAGSATIKQKH
jgi:cell division protein FtsL